MDQHAIADNGREILRMTTSCPLVELSLNVDNQHSLDYPITTMSTPATIFVTESPVLLVIVVQRISRRDVVVRRGQRTLRSAFPGFAAVLTTLWHKYDGLISQLASVKLSEVSKITRWGYRPHTADWAKTSWFASGVGPQVVEAATVTFDLVSLLGGNLQLLGPKLFCLP